MPKASSPAQRAPNLLARRRHVDVHHSVDRMQRIDDSVDHRRRRADRAGLARTLHPERVAGAGNVEETAVERRHVVGARQRVVHERAGKQLPRLRVVEPEFEQRLANALHRSAVHLAFEQERIDRTAEVIDSARTSVAVSAMPASNTREKFETIEGDVAMKKEQLELIRGSGNIYRDFDMADADVRQLKAILAAEIIKKLDRDGVSVRKAQSITGIDAGDFSRVRNADFRRISVERLMAMINGLGSRVEVKIKVRRAESAGHTVIA